MNFSEQETTPMPFTNGSQWLQQYLPSVGPLDRLELYLIAFVIFLLILILVISLVLIWSKKIEAQAQSRPGNLNQQRTLFGNTNGNGNEPTGLSSTNKPRLKSDSIWKKVSQTSSTTADDKINNLLVPDSNGKTQFEYYSFQDKDTASAIDHKLPLAYKRQLHQQQQSQWDTMTGQKEETGQQVDSRLTKPWMSESSKLGQDTGTTNTSEILMVKEKLVPFSNRSTSPINLSDQSVGASTPKTKSKVTVGSHDIVETEPLSEVRAKTHNKRSRATSTSPSPFDRITTTGDKTQPIKIERRVSSQASQTPETSTVRVGTDRHRGSGFDVTGLDENSDRLRSSSRVRFRDDPMDNSDGRNDAFGRQFSKRSNHESESLTREITTTTTTRLIQHDENQDDDQNDENNKDDDQRRPTIIQIELSDTTQTIVNEIRDELSRIEASDRRESPLELGQLLIDPTSSIGSARGQQLHDTTLTRPRPRAVQRSSTSALEHLHLRPPSSSDA